jgi:hypothetical protein
MPRRVPPEPGRQARLGVPAPHNDFTHSWLLPALNAARGSHHRTRSHHSLSAKKPRIQDHIASSATRGAPVAVWVLAAAANFERLKAPVSRRWIQPILSRNFTDGMETVGAPERAASAALAADVSFTAANAAVGKCADHRWRDRRRRSYSSTRKKSGCLCELDCWLELGTGRQRQIPRSRHLQSSRPRRPTCHSSASPEWR